MKVIKNILKYFTFVLICSMSALICSGFNAHSQNISVFANPQQIIKILQDEGFSAKLEKDSQGDPVIRSGSQGLKWSIDFYSCKKGVNCSSVQFRSGFDAEGKIAVEQVNNWNAKMRFTSAALLNTGSVILKRDLELTGGIPITSFKSFIQDWDWHLGQFKLHIGW